MQLLTRAEVATYVELLQREFLGKQFRHVHGVICPSSVHLRSFTHLPSGIQLGAQDMFWEKQGAYTGETSPLMLKDAGVTHVILGHSERRMYAGETDESVARKTQAALKYMLTPIVCIGETQAERERDQTMHVIDVQVRTIFAGRSPLQAEKIVLAYEPRWAIGGDVTPTTSEILQVKVYLRKLLTELYTPALAERITVLYGGSVKSAFLPAVSWEAEMQGVLVGRESLFPHELAKMMELAESTFATRI